MAAILGDGHAAGIQAADACAGFVQLHMGVTAEENRTRLQGRQLIGTVQMTVGQIEGQPLRFHHGIVCHAGKGQHHLIYFRFAVSANGQNPILPCAQHGDHLLGRVTLWQVVAGAVVKQIAQQNDSVRLLGFNCIHKLSAPVGRAVNVRCDE